MLEYRPIEFHGLNRDEVRRAPCISQEDDTRGRKHEQPVFASGFCLLMCNLVVVLIHPHGHMRVPRALALDMEGPALYAEGRIDNPLPLSGMFLPQPRHGSIFRIRSPESLVHERHKKLWHFLCHGLEDGIIDGPPVHPSSFWMAPAMLGGG